MCIIPENNRLHLACIYATYACTKLHVYTLDMIQSSVLTLSVVRDVHTQIIPGTLPQRPHIKSIPVGTVAPWPAATIGVYFPPLGHGVRWRHNTDRRPPSRGTRFTGNGGTVTWGFVGKSRGSRRSSVEQGLPTNMCNNLLNVLLLIEATVLAETTTL